MRPLIIIIIAIFVILAIVLIIIFARKSKGSLSFGDQIQQMRDTFNNTTTDLNNIGGLLANNFGVEWFDSMLNHGDVTLQDTPVCAHVNRKTCTAYSYIRKDMIPMLFMYPGVGSNVPCGILLDTKKIWPMITLMATVDGDTNNRSCCTNESGGSIVTRNPFSGNSNDFCIYNTLISKYGADSPYVTGKYVSYIPTIDKGDPKQTVNCNGDQTCMYNNSGGNVNQWMMNSGKLINQNIPDVWTPECLANNTGANCPTQACKDGNYKNCFNFTEVPVANVPKDVSSWFTNAPVDGYLMQTISDDCPTCTKPYLCVFDNSSGANPYEIKEEADRIGVYIGKKGEGYPEIISKNFDLGYMAITQCRFEKKDWNLWIDVVKQWYRQLLTVITPKNTMPDEYNYLLGNPDKSSYFENEVNLYINPDTNSDEYKKQNSTWQDAIIGFYYTGTKCEEQLAPLINVPSQWGEGETYHDNIDRCNGYYGMLTDDRRRWEDINIEAERELVHKVADMFNSKHNKNVPVFLCTADSNAFPNYKSLNDALNNRVTFDQIFQLDVGYSPKY